VKHYLFYIAHNYAFEILRPLQHVIRLRGDNVAWYVEGTTINQDYFHSDEQALDTIDQVIAYQPRAVFVPGNTVPSFIPGLKVQVFHGFEWKKKGHFRIRGCFDLYCTQGPFFTKKFNELKALDRHFNVVETGWSKTDTLHQAAAYTWPHQRAVKTILFAPTFSPALTSAEALHTEISRLAKNKNWQWIVKFHPKMNPQWIKMYQQITSDNLHIVETDTLSPVLQAADLMISDTSSIITEFSLLDKPVITFNNKAPEAHLLNITQANLLEETIEEALESNQILLDKIKHNAQQMHPYTDGASSGRVLDATENMIETGREDLKNKPLNLLRILKMRKTLGYWRF
jgi:CDP-glycerol glycerophosphotransferase (TagB/SpsB family)